MSAISSADCFQLGQSPVERLYLLSERSVHVGTRCFTEAGFSQIGQSVGQASDEISGCSGRQPHCADAGPSSPDAQNDQPSLEVGGDPHGASFPAVVLGPPSMAGERNHGHTQECDWSQQPSRSSATVSPAMTHGAEPSGQEARSTVSNLPMIDRNRSKVRASRRETCIWLMPSVAAMADWEQSW
jgi:hypothetical protein